MYPYSFYLLQLRTYKRIHNSSFLSLDLYTLPFTSQATAVKDVMQFSTSIYNLSIINFIPSDLIMGAVTADNPSLYPVHTLILAHTILSCHFPSLCLSQVLQHCFPISYRTFLSHIALTLLIYTLFVISVLSSVLFLQVARQIQNAVPSLAIHARHLTLIIHCIHSIDCAR